MDCYRVYYERDIYDKHCSVYCDSVREAVDKVKRNAKGEIDVYQVDRFDRRLGVFCPVWTPDSSERV